MTKFTDNLWSDLMQEHGPTLDHTDPSNRVAAVGRACLRAAPSAWPASVPASCSP